MHDYQEDSYLGYEKRLFNFCGRDAVLVLPKEPTKEKKWALKTEYFDAFPTVEAELLAKGYYIAYIRNTNRWATDDDLACHYRFRAFLMEEYGLAPRCIPIGMSCGGLFALKLAGVYPDMVSVLYLDAPVVNLLSLMQMGERGACSCCFEEEILAALQTTRAEMIAYRKHPLDYLPAIVKNRIPACLVYGNADDIVPFPENGAHVKAAYAESGVPFLSFEKDGIGHHPHGLAHLTEEECRALLAFLLQNDTV